MQTEANCNITLWGNCDYAIQMFKYVVKKRQGAWLQGCKEERSQDEMKIMEWEVRYSSR